MYVDRDSMYTFSIGGWGTTTQITMFFSRIWNSFILDEVVKEILEHIDHNMYLVLCTYLYMIIQFNRFF